MSSRAVLLFSSHHILGCAAFKLPKINFARISLCVNGSSPCGHKNVQFFPLSKGVLHIVSLSTDGFSSLFYTIYSI